VNDTICVQQYLAHVPILRKGKWHPQHGNQAQKQHG